MPSLSPKDRISLCLFTFTDGRRCRTPRIASHPHFCFYHAQKESRAQAAATLGKDLAYFFSGNYLSACDLSTALSRLIPAVIRGEVKPRLARTVAYMFQTLLQSIHISQDEYINAFSTDRWRKSVRASVNSNRDYLFPPEPDESDEPGQPVPAQPAQTQPPTPTPPPQPVPPPTQPQAAAPPSQPRTAPQQPAASTIDDTSVTLAPAQPPVPAPTPPAPTPEPESATTHPTTAEEALSIARSIFPHRPNNTPANSFSTNIYNPPRNY